MNTRREFLRSAVVSVCVVTVNSPAVGAPAPRPALSTVPRPPLMHAPMGVAGGCFVESVALLDAWREARGAEAWARLLQWGAREDDEIVAGHAVAVCESGGVLWCWDVNFGWSKLPVECAQREEPAVIAAPILRKYPRIAASFPLYRHDFPQTPGAPEPAPAAIEAGAALRDARIVGARLAAARPVNVVRFTHGAGEEKREGAAVVFVFHGRYCIYVPEAGTVPFRVRGGVGNLRLVQDLLRRVLPGVSGVRKA